MTTGRRTTTTVGRLTIAWVLGALTLCLAGAQSTGPNGGLPAVPHEIVLQQQVLPYELENVYWSINCTNTPFLKEPELSKQGVFRGMLRFRKNDTNNAIALIWDKPKGKLYLDLNRNLDLTDDPVRVSSSTSNASQQFFTNVTVLVKTAAGLHPAILDLHLD